MRVSGALKKVPSMRAPRGMGKIDASLDNRSRHAENRPLAYTPTPTRSNLDTKSRYSV